MAIISKVKLSTDKKESKKLILIGALQNKQNKYNQNKESNKKSTVPFMPQAPSLFINK